MGYEAIKRTERAVKRSRHPRIGVRIATSGRRLWRLWAPLDGSIPSWSATESPRRTTARWRLRGVQPKVLPTSRTTRSRSECEDRAMAQGETYGIEEL